MANFMNYSKLQLVVERTTPQVLGDDMAAGGGVKLEISLAGAATSGETLNILGVAVTTAANDTATQAAVKVATALTAITGITSTSAAEVVSVEFVFPTYQGTYPDEEPTEHAGDNITYTYSVYEDNRDLAATPAIVMKHSEFEDTESGLALATVAMYTLTAASPATDVIQMQRIMLSAGSTALDTTNITQPVAGKNYTPYSV